MRASVECLRCGRQYRLHRGALRQLVDCECPRCGYVGWAYVGELAAERSRLRERPVAQERLRLVV